jgi:multidrug efflux pump subunit AcrA (membrane-fusion protein)
MKSLLWSAAFVALLFAAACQAGEIQESEGTGQRAAEDSVGAPAEAEHTNDHQEGEPGRVTLTEAAHETAAIEIAVATADSFPEPVSLEVPGQVEFDPRRVTLISPRTSGRVERLTVVPGDHVRAGQTVAILYSPAYVTAQQDYLLSLRRLRALEGTPDTTGAAALARAARRRLVTLGASESAIRGVENGTEPEIHLAIRAPFAGSIMDADVLSGIAVEAGDSLFRLADLSVVDVIAQVPERALPLVELGQTATIEIAAYPGMRFDGKVERLREELNPETRTIEAVIHAPNRGRRLRPGMYATVRFAADPAAAIATRTGTPAPDTLVTIPRSAVVTDGDVRIVFVEVGPRSYERREVTVTSMTPAGSTSPSDARILVHSGIRAGDRVVSSGAFVLKSELAKGELGEHGH